MSRAYEVSVLQYVGGKESKATRRKVRKLVGMRFAYGKSVFFNSHTHEPKYELEIIRLGIIECVFVAKKCGEEFNFSRDEFRQWQTMFPGTSRPGQNRP